MPTLLIHPPRKQPSMFILVVVWEQHCIRGLLFPCNTIPFLVEFEQKGLGANDTFQGIFSIPSYDSTSPQPLQIETAISKIQRKPLSDIPSYCLVHRNHDQWSVKSSLSQLITSPRKAFESSPGALVRGLKNILHV